MSATTIISVGELLVEFVSQRKGCELSEQTEYFGPYPSGASAVCLDQAARLGARAKIFGGIGEDGFGCAIIERLADSGVDTTGIALHSDKTTGVAFASFFEDASRISISHVDNSAAEWAGKVVTDLPETELLLHVSGSSLCNVRLRSTTLALVDEVLARGGRISCAPNARPELMNVPKASQELRKVMAASSILFLSEEDLELLYPGRSEEDVVAAMRAMGAEIVALKQGVDGAVICQGEARHELWGHDVEQVDPAGASDSFCGAFLAMLVEGHSIEAASRYANAAASLAGGKSGPMAGNASLADIEALLSFDGAKRMTA